MPDIYEHKATLKCMMALGDLNAVGLIEHQINPVDDFTYDEVHEKEVKDSITEGNIQVIHKWPRWTFDLSVPATADNIGYLQWALSHNQRFSIRIEAVEPGGYNPKTVNFQGCYAIRKSERIVANDVPIMTFSCIALRGTAGGISNETIAGLPFDDYKPDSFTNSPAV